MVRPGPVKIRLSPARVSIAEAYARAACLGGRSNVRSRADREGALWQDQLVGQIGTLAGHLLWFGDDGRYVASREKANAHPWEGDGGSDVPGANVDFKTSLMRAGRDPLDYNLLVRPRERHPGWIYLLMLLEGMDALHERGATVYLVGWATDDMLPDTPAPSGAFAGAHVVRGRDLIPFPRVRWLTRVPAT